MTSKFENRKQFLVAQGHQGHRLMYVRILAESLFDAGIQPVLICSEEALTSKEFRVHLSQLPGLAVETLSKFDFFSLKRFLKRQAVSEPVVFTEGDYWLKQFVFFGLTWKFRSNFLVMREKSQSTKKFPSFFGNVSKKIVRMFVRRNSKLKVFVLGNSGSKAGSKNHVSDPVSFSGDPTVAKELKEVWNSQSAFEDSRWIGVLGSIGERKNIELIAQTISELADQRPIGFVLVGELECSIDDLENWLHDVRMREIPVILQLGATEEVIFDSVLSALDCVVVAHSNEGPSGIFAKALASGTRILTSGSQTLKHASEEFIGNALWVSLDKTSMLEGLTRILEMEAPEPVNNGFADFTTKLLR